MKRFLLLFCLVLWCASMTPAQGTSSGQTRDEPPPISDNSFLIEEAYNQEKGIVQYSNTFVRERGGNWVYTFTQEWPVRSQKHQLSYTLAMLKQNRGDPVVSSRGFGDFGLNYRYQLISNNKVAVAPRLSLLLPTGDAGKEMGAGALGFQVNLPVSITHGKRIVSHWNAGATFIPSAENASGEKANIAGLNLGQSFVVLASPRFNLFLETVWSRDQLVAGPSMKRSETSFFLNPGIRWAHNFRSGLQIVPGIAVPLGVGPSRGERGIFFYLSFEHPFGKQPR